MIIPSKSVKEMSENPHLDAKAKPVKDVPPFKPFLEKESEERQEESLFEFLARQEREKKNDNLAEHVLPPPLPFPFASSSLSLALAPVALPAALVPLFEAMVGMIEITLEKGIIETTLTLDAPQYVSSPFYGTQIVIREFSSAPKIFNVELITQPGAADLLQKNAEKLLGAIQSERYNFSINRLETRLLEPQPLEKDEPDFQDQQQNERNE